MRKRVAWGILRTKEVIKKLDMTCQDRISNLFMQAQMADLTGQHL